MIIYKSYTDLKAEAARSYLGVMWWLIEPILYLAAFYILLVVILHRGGPDFVPVFLCGAVVWKWFDSGVKGGGQSVHVHSGLLQQVYVPKFVFPLIAVFGSTARFIPVFLVFIVFLLVYGVDARPSWLSLPIILLAQFAMVTAVAMLTGAVTPFLPDLKVVIDNGMMLVFFMSGVFFNLNDVHEPIRSYLLLNPMAALISEYRSVMIYGQWPNPSHIALILSFSLIVGFIGVYLLRKLDRRYGKVGF
ncbi:ABC transporter permease [Pseudomonas taiwanensis]|uniref:ABC transporter permease n=1 Tax=Pseudomonas taiwanensis TaxID=470150 RepID=UPI0015B8B01C|nr:ABC transporter permease [Pseudomonas taiwanensis]